MERAGGYGVKAKTSTERLVRSQQDFQRLLAFRPTPTSLFLWR
jgi:hypothetical protein